jgi:MYXO-CTERM domain-containing protein
MPLLVLALLSSTTAEAYQHKTNDSGALMRWEEPTVGFKLNTAGDHGMNDDALEEAAFAAVDEYRFEGNHLTVDYMGRTKTRRVEYADGENVIYFEPEWDERLGADPSLLMLTFVFSQDSGESVAADVVVNEQHHEWDTKGGGDDSNDFGNALTHEVGHALGLAHSDVADATMFSSTYPGETRKRTLSDDDIAGLVSLYGVPMSPRDAMGCSSTGGGPVGALGIGLASLAIAGVMRRRRDSDT